MHVYLVETNNKCCQMYDVFWGGNGYNKEYIHKSSNREGGEVASAIK